MNKPIKKFTAKLAQKLQKITKSKVELGHARLINRMSIIAQTSFYLPDQTIIRQDALPDGFYFIIMGDCVVYQESEGDFKDYDYFEEKRILQNPEDNADTDAESEFSPSRSWAGGSMIDDSFGSPLSPQKSWGRARRLNTGLSASGEASPPFIPAPIGSGTEKKVSFLDVRKMEHPEGSGSASIDVNNRSFAETPGKGKGIDAFAELETPDYKTPTKLFD